VVALGVTLTSPAVEVLVGIEIRLLKKLLVVEPQQNHH
jgi:hypothetical protein